MKNFAPKKSLGQHFLHDKNIARKIANEMDYTPKSVIVEIGPGTGVLTNFILENDVLLYAYEIDDRSVDYLNERFAIESNVKFFLKKQDFLTSDLHGISKQHNQQIQVIGNIPYYITSQILFHLIENSQFIKRATIMMQKELAARIKASPNSKEYGILTIASSLFFEISGKFEIPPSCFLPPPKVMSTCLTMNFHNPFPDVSVSNKLKIIELSKFLFNQRRKKISNSLQNYLNNKNIEISKVLANAELKKYLDLRPEDLYVQDFIILYNLIHQL